MPLDSAPPLACRIAKNNPLIRSYEKGERVMTRQPISNASAQERATKQTTLKRRGVIAGAAALAAGLLAKQTAQTVSAAYNFQGDTGNTATATTSLSGSVGGTLFALTNT